MLKAARVLALTSLVAIAAGNPLSAREAPRPDAPAGFADTIDASRLPRLGRAQELFASPSTTSFLVRESLEQASDATRALLAAQGWQQAGAPVSSNTPHQFAIMNFTKASHRLNVFITVAPEQGGATWVQYTPIAIEQNLPLARNPRRPQNGPVKVELIASRPLR